MNFIGLLLVFLLLFPMVIQFHPDIALPLTILIVLFGYMIFKGYNFLDTIVFFLLVFLCLFFKIKQCIIILALMSIFLLNKYIKDKFRKDTYMNNRKTRRE